MSNNGVVLVCITPQKSSRQLIECGRHLADEQNAALKIVCVFPQKKCYMPDLEILDFLNDSASEFDAEIAVCFSDQPVERIAEEAQHDSIRLFVVGFPGKNSTNFVSDLHQKINNIPFCMVDRTGVTYSIGNPLQDSPDKNTTQIIFNAK